MANGARTPGEKKGALGGGWSPLPVANLSLSTLVAKAGVAASGGHFQTAFAIDLGNGPARTREEKLVARRFSVMLAE